MKSQQQAMQQMQTMIQKEIKKQDVRVKVPTLVGSFGFRVLFTERSLIAVPCSAGCKSLFCAGCVMKACSKNRNSVLPVKAKSGSWRSTRWTKQRESSRRFGCWWTHPSSRVVPDCRCPWMVHYGVAPHTPATISQLSLKTANMAQRCRSALSCCFYGRPQWRRDICLKNGWLVLITLQKKPRTRISSG